MSTLHTSKKTDDGVLPQPRPLETVPADNSGVGTKRGTVDSSNARNAGVQHGRGETISDSPVTNSVTVEPDMSGQPVPGRKPRQVTPVVPVLGKDGAPLMPTHPARARELLRKGRAVVANHTPFVIRLKDRKINDGKTAVQDIGLGIDPGSKYTGFAVFTVKTDVDEQTGEVVTTRRGKFALQVDHRSHQISKRLVSRAQVRGTRRSRNLRYRAPRFLNRTRPKGWLAPSLRHRVDGIKSMTRKLTRWFPITEIHQELVRFDLQKMMNPEISGVEYHRGTLAGAEVREYLLAKFKRTCLYCGAKDTPLNLDHVHPKSRGGSNRVTNLVLACIPCNQKKGNRPVEEFVKDSTKLQRILGWAKAPLREATAVNSTRWAVFDALEAFDVPLFTGSGGLTKFNRTRNDLSKTHCSDALSVGTVDVIASVPRVELVVAHTGRGTYQRVMTDKYGFAKSHRSRQKEHYGFTTGDLVRAVIPKGKYKGTHVGRVAVRATGHFNIAGKAESPHRHITRLQRGNGWSWRS